MHVESQMEGLGISSQTKHSVLMTFTTFETVCKVTFFNLQMQSKPTLDWKSDHTHL